MVWPYDVTTWCFEGDVDRLFLRGQWSLFRLAGNRNGVDGSELALRWTRCSYLTKHVESWLKARVSPSDDSRLLIFPDGEAQPQSAGPDCTTVLDSASGQRTSAEGCYSCAIFTGQPTLKVSVRAVMFSDHSATPVWWAFGRLARLSPDICRPNPASQHSQPPWPSCVGEHMAQWLLEDRRFDKQTFLAEYPRGQVNNVLTGNCTHLSWLEQCPGANRCLPQLGPLPRGAVVVSSGFAKELLTLGETPSRRPLPCTLLLPNMPDVSLTGSGPACEPVREAAVFHFRVWDHRQARRASNEFTSLCQLDEKDWFRRKAESIWGSSNRAVGIRGKLRTICELHFSKVTHEWIISPPNGSTRWRTGIGYGRNASMPCPSRLRCVSSMSSTVAMQTERMCAHQGACVGFLEDQLYAVNQALIERKKASDTTAHRCRECSALPFYHQTSLRIRVANTSTEPVVIHQDDAQFRGWIGAVLASMQPLVEPSFNLTVADHDLPQIMFAITSDGSLASLARVEALWAHTARAGYAVRVYSGHAEREVTSGLTERVLEAVDDAEYPPLNKNFYIWHALAADSQLPRNESFARPSPQWYARCDDDTFLDAKRLALQLHRAFPSPDTRSWYTGRSGRGRARERAAMQINFPYALGGSCEIVSVAALRALSGKLLSCLAWVNATRLLSITHWTAFGHSDVEFGRCLFQKAAIPFSFLRAERRLFPVLRHRQTPGRIPGIDYEGLAYLMKTWRTAEPAISVHPIKSVALARYAVDAIQEQRTPIIPWGHTIAISTTCAHNPAAIKFATACCNDRVRREAGESRALRYLPFRTFCLADTCSHIVPECAPQTRAANKKHVNRFLRGAHGVIVSLSPLQREVQKKARQLSKLLRVPMRVHAGTHGVSAFKAPIGQLSLGELGLRESFRSAAEQAMRAGATALLWIEDDALMHRNLSDRWASLLDCPRCTGFLHSAYPGGALLLGASEWSIYHSRVRVASPWAVEQDPTPWQKEWSTPLPTPRCGNGQSCYNALHKTQGTFACILSQHTLPALLEWLSHSNRPIDHFWEYLVWRGFPVRVAYPNLFIMDVAHSNSVAARPVNSIPHAQRVRCRLMHWNTRYYIRDEQNASEGEMRALDNFCHLKLRTRWLYPPDSSHPLSINISMTPSSQVTLRE